MKSTLFVCLLIAIAFVNAEYNLLAFGDIGQVDIFNSRNPGKLYSGALKANKTEKEALKNVHTLLNEEEFYYENNRCIMTVKGKTVNRRKEGYTNFNNLLCGAVNYIKKSDQITILGDMIYAENKGLPVNDKYIVDKEVQHKLEDRTFCAMNWFEDIVDNFHDYCPLGNEAVHRKLWDSKNGKINRNFYILEGNHAFDVNYMKVSDSIADMSTAKAFYVGSGLKSQRKIRKNDLHKFPRFFSVKKDKVSIEFVDLNTMILVMLLDVGKGTVRKEEDYKKFATKALKLSKVLPYKDALNYLKYTFKAINMFTDSSDWRIIRSHHPPMNIEGGFNEQKYFWNVKYEGKTLFDVMKEKKVKIYLASHHHSGHVVAFPYNSFESLKTKKFQEDKSKGVHGNCVFHPPSSFQNDAKEFNLSNTCPVKPLQYNLADNFKSNKDGYLWIFVSGNSGRELDVMEDSKKSRGSLIWGRSIAKQYGGVNMAFGKDKFTATYFDITKDGASQVAASFTFTNVAKPVSYKVIEQEVQLKLK